MPSETPALRDPRGASAPFFGREDILAELLRLAAGDPQNRGWVLLTGAPGAGKSALLEQLRPRLEHAGARIAHHALRPDHASSNRPELIARSLAAQIEALYPTCAAGQSEAPQRLGELLSRVSFDLLVPRGERLILLVDGLDEVEREGAGKNPLPRFLPAVLPPGVVLIASTQPADPHAAWLDDREGLTRLSLDDPRWSASSEQACRAFFQHHGALLDPPLDPALVDDALRRGRGNLLHAVTLHARFALDPASRRRAPLLEGLDALAAQLRAELFEGRARLARSGPVPALLGLLAAAREPLPLRALREALAAEDLPDLSDLPAAARVLLTTEGEPRALRFAHPFFRDLVASALGEAAMRAQHRRLADTLALWPPRDRRDLDRRRYALRHAISHAVEAADLPRAERIAGDLDYLEVKCREEGPSAVEGDLRRALISLSGEPGAARLSALHRAVRAEENHLRAHPAALPGLVYNRLRCSGFSPERIETSFHFPRGLPAPRLRHPVHLDQGVELTLTGHTAEINDCAISADGRRAISASADRTLRVWDLESGHQLATLTGHTEEITACAMSPDGSRAVSAAADRTLRIWDLATRTCQFALPRRPERANALVVTPDGEQAICAADGDVIQVWDLRSGRCLKSLSGYAEENSARGLSADGSTVFSASYDNRVEVWQLDTGLIQTLLVGHGAPVDACVLTPDQKRAVSASDDGTLRVWDLATGKEIKTLSGHGAGVRACAITADGRQLLSASADRTLKLWDLESGHKLDTLSGHTEAVTACALSRDGAVALSASADHTLKVWTLTRRRTSAPAHGGEVQACAINARGTRVVSGSADKTLQIWDASTGERLRTLEGHSAGVNACALTPDGRRVVSASYDRSLKVWDLERGELLSTLTGHAAGVNACVVSADGKRLLSASYDSTLHLWDLAAGKVLTTFTGHGDFVNACALTPDGKHALSASADRTLRLWELSSGKTLSVLSGHSSGVNAVVITPDGKHAISASYDKTLRVWDLRTGKTVRFLPGHTEGVTACALTADGQTLVSASYDGTLRVWNVDSGDCWGRTLGRSPFRSVAIAPDLIAAGDAQGNVWILDLPDPEELVPASYALPRINLE